MVKDEINDLIPYRTWQLSPCRLDSTHDLVRSGQSSRLSDLNLFFSFKINDYGFFVNLPEAKSGTYFAFCSCVPYSQMGHITNED